MLAVVQLCRCAVVQDLTNKFSWRHVKGNDNPADVISRGLMPEEIESCELWWNGPEWLKKPKKQWPQSSL